MMRRYRSFMRGLGGLSFASALLLLAACASRAPAPVVERPPPGARAQTTAPAAVPSSRTAERPEFYTVRAGDTVYNIAITQGVDYRELIALNKLDESGRVSIGQVLRLRRAGTSASAPSASAEDVLIGPIVGSAPIQAQPIEPRPLDAPKPLASQSLPPGAPSGSSPGLAAGARTEPRAYKLPYSDENLALILREGRAEPRAAQGEARVESKPELKPPAPEVKPPSSEAKPPAPEAKIEPKPEAGKPPAAGERDRVDWQWPSNGRVIGNFEGGNKGVDIGGNPGDPVLAAAAGRVVYSGSGLRGYGQLIIVKHNDVYLSAYAHNSRLLVKEGQSVSKGQKIAELGQTDADRPKLHFEIRRNGNPVNPLDHLPARPAS